MTWRVVLSDPAWQDLDRLDALERPHVEAELAAWVDTGPPRGNTRDLAGTSVFEDPLATGHVTTYFTDETVPYVAVLRIRKRPA